MLKALLFTAAALSPVTASLASAPVDRAGERVEVQIYDRDEGRYLPVVRHRGRLYVAGEPGHEYEIRLRSREDRRLLAVTSVDGVNVISGDTASPQQSGYVLDGHGSVSIEGWRKSMQRVATFYFTDLPDSYAARTGRPHDVGVIGVALFEERRRPRHPWWKREDERFRSEDRAQSESAPRAKAYTPGSQSDNGQLGTGHGRNEWSQAQYTDFERASDRPAEVITIYYDSRRNLVAQGILPPERRWARWQRPDPFPADARFAPDPWR